MDDELADLRVALESRRGQLLVWIKKGVGQQLGELEAVRHVKRAHRLNCRKVIIDLVGKNGYRHYLEMAPMRRYEQAVIHRRANGLATLRVI